MSAPASLRWIARAGVGALALAAWTCSVDEAPPPTPIRWPVPANLGGELPSPARNPITAEGVALGRRLFFDPGLSRTGTIACATCHRPELGFSDGGERSVGASGRPLRRHTPALVNLAWMDGYFWDGGARDLESQVFAPLFSDDEMGADLDSLLATLRGDPGYVDAFRQAFGAAPSLPFVARALAQYERTLVAADSRYDRHVRGEDPTALGVDERRGLELFRQSCAGCHVPDLFTDGAYHNTGLDAVFPEDHERVAWGRARITGECGDIGKFRTPSLRNVALTAPYMHDGRFATLGEVVDHYRGGFVRSPTLDPRIAGPDGAPRIVLSDDDAAALVAFLEALTECALENPQVRAPNRRSTPGTGREDP
ncbi:MAG: cytochrome c peroxidase [Nannocystaceae bacterium]